MKIGIIIAIIVVVLGVWAIKTTNGFKKKEIKIQEALSGIEVALTKRYDMLTKMLDVAKNYAGHEKDVFFETIHLRQGMSVQELNEVDRVMNKMSDAIKLTAEAYPELRSSDVFGELQRGIRDAEEHLQAARRLYNASVTSYNTAIVMFPAKLLAGGRSAAAFFETQDEKKNDVEMTF